MPNTDPPLKDSCFVIEFDAAFRGKEIGRGCFGTVYLGSYKDQPVAVKIIHVNTVTVSCNLSDSPTATTTLKVPKSILQEFLEEVELMGAMIHPNVVRLIGACLPPDPLCIVLEYCVGSGLDRVINDESQVMDKARVLRYSFDIASGMAYLHAANIIHLDFKPQNVLISAEDTCKISDFGLSRKLIINATSMSNNVAGTPAFTAPEVFRGERLTRKVDVYAFGITLWSMITRLQPFEGWKVHPLIYSVVSRNKRPETSDEMDPKLVELMKACWSGDPYERPDFKQILQDVSKEIPSILVAQQLRVEETPPETANLVDVVTMNPAAVLLWSATDVAKWLNNIGFAAYSETFLANEIDGGVLLKLTEADLKEELAVSTLGARKKLMEQLASLNRNVLYSRAYLARSMFEDALTRKNAEDLLLDARRPLSPRRRRNSTNENSGTATDPVNHEDYIHSSLRQLVSPKPKVPAKAAASSSSSLPLLPWPSHPVILDTFVMIMKCNSVASLFPANERFEIYQTTCDSIQQLIKASLDNTDFQELNTIKKSVSEYSTDREMLNAFSKSLKIHFATAHNDVMQCTHVDEKGEVMRHMLQDILHVHGGVGIIND